MMAAAMSTSSVSAHAPPKFVLSSAMHGSVEPRTPHKASMLIIHGLGDTAEGWSDVGLQLAREFPFMRFVLPTAPERPVTLNRGMIMPSWYDIKGLESRAKEPCDGLDDSLRHVAGLIDKEIAAGVPANRIIVAGFSQGGAMALLTGLTHPRSLGGVVSMSGYLPRPAEFAVHKANANTPVLFCHGDDDDVVHIEWARASAARVKEAGATRVDFKTYRGMEHSACRAEIDDVIAFVRAVVSDLESDGDDEL